MGATAEMDARGLGGRERHDVGNVAFHEPFEAIEDTDDVNVLQDSADRGGGNDAIDPWGRTPADEDG